MRSLGSILPRDRWRETATSPPPAQASDTAALNSPSWRSIASQLPAKAGERGPASHGPRAAAIVLEQRASIPPVNGCPAPCPGARSGRNTDTVRAHISLYCSVERYARNGSDLEGTVTSRQVAVVFLILDRPINQTKGWIGTLAGRGTVAQGVEPSRIWVNGNKCFNFTCRHALNGHIWTCPCRRLCVCVSDACQRGSRQSPSLEPSLSSSDDTHEGCEYEYARTRTRRELAPYRIFKYANDFFLDKTRTGTRAWRLVWLRAWTALTLCCS